MITTICSVSIAFFKRLLWISGVSTGRGGFNAKDVLNEPARFFGTAVQTRRNGVLRLLEGIRSCCKTHEKYKKR
jgi:hypothetical protein